jgi:putative SOS response-associated peptidase YedK
VVCALN